MILREGIELYHAGYKVIENVDLSLCASGKDFGRGFYVTTDFKQACRFIKTAIGKALKNRVPGVDENTGFISIFECRTNVMNELKYHEFVFAEKQWLHCIAAHRKSGILNDELAKWKDFDVMTGKIANDATNQVLTAYINGLYGEAGSVQADETAIRLLLPNRLSDQICFRTEASLKALCFKGFKTVNLEAQDAKQI